MDPISAEQYRGARAMLGWSQSELAEAAGVSRTLLVEFERGARTPHRNNLDAMPRAMEAAGIEFINESGGDVGVRFRSNR